MGNNLTVQRLRGFRKKTRPDVMFLMETKNQDETVLRMFRNTDYVNHFTVPPVGLSGGLCLSWTNKVQIDILSSSPNLIDVQLTWKIFSSLVSFVYGPPKAKDRPAFWESIKLLGAGRKDAWLLAGDFNDLLHNDEKVGGPLRWKGSFLSFRSFVSQNGLWDLQHFCNDLSWRGTRYNHLIHSKLDRAMANVAWSESFPSEYLNFEGSDHRPVLIFFDQNLKRNKGLFRFDRRVKEKPEIRELVQDNWCAEATASVISKISRVRAKIVEWIKLQNLNSKLEIVDFLKRLEEALTSTSHDPVLIGNLTTRLEKAFKDEEEFWRQRSRIMWLQAGDRNSSYFHAKTRGRRMRNKFSVIEDAAGRPVYEETEIVNTISQHYSDLFTSGSSGSLDIVRETIRPLVSEDMNKGLITTPTLSEIRTAVFSINPDKAPGPDGFSASFYQTFWDIIGEDISRDIQGFFSTGTLNRDRMKLM